MDTTSISSLPSNNNSSNMQPGMQPGMQQGMQPGMQQGMQQGMQPGMQQGMQQGMQPGMQQGMQPGMQQGMQPGMQATTVSNVSPSTSYQPNITASSPSVPQTLTRDMIQEVSSTIQKASLDGSTQLPSRDIPRDTLHLAADVHVNAEHIPIEEKIRDYIGDYDDTQEVIQKHMAEQQKFNQMESIYNEIQTPVLIMLLYFLFQLPVVNSMVFKVFPKLFHNDGNLTMGGLFLKTILYGTLYYGIMKGIAFI